MISRWLHKPEQKSTLPLSSCARAGVVAPVRRGYCHQLSLHVYSWSFYLGGHVG